MSASLPLGPLGQRGPPHDRNPLDRVALEAPLSVVAPVQRDEETVALVQHDAVAFGPFRDGAQGQVEFAQHGFHGLFDIVLKDFTPEAVAAPWTAIRDDSSLRVPRDGGDYWNMVQAAIGVSA